MRNIILLAATAAAFTAAPAIAQDRGGEARVEARGGIAWAGGGSQAFVGIAAGYDLDVGQRGFIGIEGSADQVLADGADVFLSATGRVGTRVGARGKLYALGGYGFADGNDAPFIGAGYQHQLGGKLYGKVEYRHTLDSGTDINFAGIGLGVSF